MARTKNRGMETAIQFLYTPKCRNLGEYVRLSKEDMNRGNDDSNRESLQKLIADAMNRKIDCVIVKDLSHLSRNYTEARSGYIVRGSATSIFSHFLFGNGVKHKHRPAQKSNKIKQNIAFWAHNEQKRE